MATLTSKKISETYKDLLTVNSGTDNQGLESSLKTISDGEGVESALQLSTTTLKIPAGKTLEVAGTLDMDGTLDVDGDFTADSITIGGGYPSTGVTISNTGNIQAAGVMTVDGNIKSGGIVQATSITPDGNNKPKLDLTSDTNISLKLNDTVNIMNVSSLGEMKITNTSGVQKFLVRDDGRVKLTGMTTSTRTGIAGEAGDMVYDTELKAFFINDGE